MDIVIYGHGHIGLYILSKSSRDGDASGINNVGFCYLYGIGIEKDENKAFIYFQKSAEMGFTDGMSSMAKCYRNGIGVIRDLDKAKNWYQRSNGKDIKKLEIEDDLKKIFIESKYQLCWIFFDEFKCNEVIGKGGFATVYHAECAYIADLGLSITVSIALKSNSDGIYGILLYIAPKVLNKHPYTKESDIYSFGIISWEILYGKPVPFDQKSELLFKLQVCNGLRPHSYENIATFYTNLMKKCWNMDPKKRPTANEIYDTFVEWQNNENILLELSESDKKLQNIKNENMHLNIKSDYRSRVISFNNSYRYQGSKLRELQIPNI
ncbi:kinase-like domain-containing protein [Gigaspora rosea]|uniref:Kinase-like domain-containing protein n=1 Tax=Gigaspora rosea TaxID=44941 RepID=A0A397VFG7_9GLOM|nr:kinase-like domain-containing protein [Gigaspora rosea]